MRDWISNEQSFSIASGEKVNFVFAINVPNNVEGQEYSSVATVECGDYKASTPLTVKIISSPFDFFILSSVRDGLNLVTTYVLQENSGEAQEVSLKYTLLSGEGVAISDGIETVFLEANQRLERVLEIEIPRNAQGNFVLSFEVVSGDETFETEQPVNIGGVTGFAISDSNLKTISIFGAILLVLGALVFVIRFIQKNYSKTTDEKNKKREFIPLKIKSEKL